jgi:hypothetical protein
MIRKFEVALLMAVLFAMAVDSPASAKENKASDREAAKAAAGAPVAEVVDPKALAAKRRWLLAQRAESGGTGEASWRLLKAPMDLPDVPRYTGAGTEFSEGLLYPNKPGGAAVSMTYRAKEAPDVVLSWYEDALKNYQWKTKTKGTGANAVISGMHGNNGITVTVSPTKARGFRTDLRISYKLARK